MHSVTLQFATVEDLTNAMARLLPPAQLELPFADRPDVGVELAPPKIAEVVERSAALLAESGDNPFATGGTQAASGFVAGLEVDSAGLPWDNRIHGSTKSRNADGTWRQKRGLNDPAVKVAVEAELRAVMGARVPESAAMPPSDVPPSPIQQAQETFGTLMVRLAPKIAADADYGKRVHEVLVQYGLTGLGQLAARPDLVSAFAAHIGA